MVISTGAASSVGRVGGHLHTPGGGRLGAISAPNTPDRARAPAGQRVTRQESHGRRRTPRTGDPAPRARPRGEALGAGRRFILSRKQPRVIHRMAMACTSHAVTSVVAATHVTTHAQAYTHMVSQPVGGVHDKRPADEPMHLTKHAPVN
jgi:hypothetical protein